MFTKKEIGKAIVQSCGGLPLAITVLAGLLARKNTVPEWLNVRDSIDGYSRGDRHLKSKYEHTSRVLALSYDDLPERLKLCFQYLGNFPDNYEIPVKRLSQLWMAEGLITPKSSASAESMEDASNSCLNELVERCMVQVAKHGLTGNIKTCCLHDLLRDLCRSKDKSENFLHVMNSSAASETQEASFNKVRRLAIHLDGIGHQLAPPNDVRHAPLRSLLYFVRGHFYSDGNRKLLRSLFKDFKLLRVLQFEDIKAEPEVELPSILGNLVHLRFLSLRNSEIKQFPLYVANLACLQTLDLRCVDWMCVTISNVFRKMEQLRHLYLPLNHQVTEKLSLATLKNLRTLVNVSSEGCDLKDIVELTNLRKLVVDAPRSTEFKNLEDIMKSRDITFDHLQSLSLTTGNGNGNIPMHILLSCPNLYKLQLYGRIKVFPEDHLCSNLSKLTLEETHLMGGQIKLLQDLPNLRKLYLRMGAFKSETIVVSPGGFPQLEFLSLLGLCELNEWTVGKGAMPNLHSLHIGYCWGLEAVPAGIQNISTLKELIINRMYRQFCNRLREGGEDFDKIRHVPSVKITNIRQSTEVARYV